MKRKVSAVLAAAMVGSCLVSWSPAFAEESIGGNAADRASTADEERAIAFAEKVTAASDHFESGPDGTIIINAADDLLQEKYAFEAEELTLLRTIASGAPVPVNQNSQPSASTMDTRIGYISNGDLLVGPLAVLVGAAIAGPEALALAFTGVASIIGGPLGGIIGGGIALLGASFFLDLAAKITGAVVQGKGVAFYSKWGFPPLETKIE